MDTSDWQGPASARRHPAGSRYASEQVCAGGAIGTIRWWKRWMSVEREAANGSHTGCALCRRSAGIAMQVGGLARADLEYIHRERGIQTPNRQCVCSASRLSFQKFRRRPPPTEEVLRNAFFLHNTRTRGHKADACWQRPKLPHDAGLRLVGDPPVSWLISGTWHTRRDPSSSGTTRKIRGFPNSARARARCRLPASLARH